MPRRLPGQLARRSNILKPSDYYIDSMRRACSSDTDAGEGSFVRPNGLIMATARSLPRLLSFNVVAITPLPLHTRRLGAESVRTAPSWASRARVKKTQPP
jgi:hypothetical protein